MQPIRFITLPAEPELFVLTATARGMIEGNFIRAAQRAFTELMATVVEAGLKEQVGSVIGLIPDRPAGANDAKCRYVGGVIFGHDLAQGAGEAHRPDLGLTGSLAWMTLAPARYAVFSHQGPYETLKLAWAAVYSDWLPSSGERPRHDVTAFELHVRRPDRFPPHELLTEMWLPLE